MRNKFKQLVTIVVLGGGLMISYPTKAFDEDKCTPEVGTAFTAQNGERFCISKITMANWFTAFSWCKAVGGHLASVTEACNGQFSSCNNIKGSGRSGNAWIATPRDKNQAVTVNLSSGSVSGNSTLYLRANNGYTYYALCK